MVCVFRALRHQKASAGFIVVCVMTTLLTACGGGSAHLAPSPQLVRISVTPSTSTLASGQTLQLAVSGAFSDGTSTDQTSLAKWVTSDSSIAAVTSSGSVVAKGAGIASISASVGGMTTSATVKVTSAAPQSIDLSPSSLSVPLGETAQLKVTAVLTDGSVQDVTHTAMWSVSDTSVISIDSSATLTATKIGTSSLTATLGSLSASSQVSVVQPSLVSIALSSNMSTILIGATVTFTAQAVYSDGTKQDVSGNVAWSSASPDVLSIDPAGHASALGVGSAAIEATLDGVAGTSTEVVHPVALVTYFSAGQTSPDSTLRIGGASGTNLETCAMVYVFSQDQQMAECCGCEVSMEGLRTLSLKGDLLSNPLTGIRPAAGSVLLLTADYKADASCNPAAVIPAGLGVAWATHLQTSGTSVSATETTLTQTQLGETLLSNVQAQCSFIQQLGAGRGICTCGTGD